MKIGILGTGRVGSAIAFSIIIKGLADELVLANRTLQTAEGEAQDLSHAAAFSSHKVRIRASEIESLSEMDIVILTCSIPIARDVKTRNELVAGNVALYKKIIPNLAARNPNAILLVVANPVDVMTHVTLKLSQFPISRVMGTGTLLDSARYRSLLSDELHVHPDDIRAYILGEHGDCQFPALSLALTGGERLDQNEAALRLFDATVRSGYEVMQKKGYSNYGIALAASLIIESIVRNEHRTMPVSSFIEGYYGVNNVCLSVPCIIGREGIIGKLEPALSKQEVAQFQKAASEVREITEQNFTTPSMKNP